MIDLRKLLLIVIPWSFSLGLDAQTSTDTIQLSMKFSEKSDYSNAIAILVSYVSFHPADSNALQLIGLNYYWDKQYREADRFYGEQVEKHPEYSNLKLDYARMLFERKQFKRAGPAIKEFLLENPRNTEAREYLGYLNYWDGEYKEALSEFDLILQIYPDNKTALGMTRAIKELTRPYFFAFHEYSFDSQPMESGMQTVESGKYFSSFLNPGLKADLLYFNLDSSVQVPWFQLGNKFSIFKNRTHFDAEIGLFQNVLSETDVSGLLRFTQRVTPNLSLNITGKKKPYFYTLGSIRQNVSFKSLNAGISWTDPNSVSMQFSGEKQFFMDDNQITNAFLWVLSPGFGWSALKFNFGYGYSYIDADSNTFSSLKSLDELLADYKEGQIEGVYNPYFTAENQHIHTIIGNLSLLINNNFKLDVKGNLGFYAYADIPYLYLDKDKRNVLFINKGYSREMKIPYEIGATANWLVNEKITLSAKYLYTENFFYYNNMFNLGFNYIFL